MSPIVISLIAFGFIFGGALVGMLLRAVLSEAHLTADTKDVVRLSMGLIGTIAALVLGLLIASAKSSYDARNAQVKQITVNIVLVDNFLEQYGPEALTVRRHLRTALVPMINKIWNENESASAASFEASTEAKMFFGAIQLLTPRNDPQRALQARVMQLSTDLAQARLLLFTQADNSIPMPFLAILVFWLTMIFTSFSVFIRTNAIAIAALFVCALSAAGAIFLILEMARPFSGLLALSSEPLRHALGPLP
jgi:hypothetical protein